MAGSSCSIVARRCWLQCAAFWMNRIYPNDLLFAVRPPGVKAARYDEGTPAGPRLPGWQVTLGFLLIGTMAVLALVSGQALRRQMRLASLKTFDKILRRNDSRKNKTRLLTLPYTPRLRASSSSPDNAVGNLTHFVCKNNKDALTIQPALGATS
jgi:hypothetical protein